MVFVKILKTKAYFKRFQVKRRRRREGKTDYRARGKMVRQAKNKYNSKKSRFVVRFTNKRVICQVVYATIAGDRVVAQADSSELKNYGIPAGLKNYPAAYCTGLLLARRLLKEQQLDGMFEGKDKVDGEEFHIEDEGSERRPFKCILDVGPQTTTSGHRMWGALKGAVDGGLHIPHSIKNFPGYKAPEEKGQEPEYDAEVHKDRIFGNHVKEYMESLAEEDPTKYQAHFSKYIVGGIDADGLENMYAECHRKIRADPTFKAKPKKTISHERKDDDKAKVTCSDSTTHQRCLKLTLAERREKVTKKILAAQEKCMIGLE